MSADAFLATWAALTQQLTQLIDAALDVEPPGGLPDSWAATLKQLGVKPLGDDARIAAIKEHKQTKGAPLPEVSACLTALSTLAKKQLEPLRRGLSAEQALAVDDGVHRFTDQALAHYRAKATEKKKMFGAAKALAAQHQYGSGLNATAYVLGCASCHAPRLGDALHCAFCGGQLEVVS
ncbi:MAG: hypothetical protein QM817_32045 [Archangium sp.]